MKSFIVLALTVAILAIETSASEYLLGNLAGDRGEQLDSDYLERCKKSQEFVGHFKLKSAYGHLPPPPAYARPAPAYAPSYPAPAHMYAPPTQSLSYSAPAPKIPCSKAIVVSCTPSVVAAPCSAPAGAAY